MNTAEYISSQQAISSATAAYASRLGGVFLGRLLSNREWLNLLQTLYPVVRQWRSESAVLARDFYDDERTRMVPDLPRNMVDLEGSDFTSFVKSMEPARKKMMSPVAADAVFTRNRPEVTALVMQTVREVENAGRNQIIHAVEQDEPLRQAIDAVKATAPPAQARDHKLVRGWARVATGEETCAWCLMLVSRGPVYQDASSAGLDLPDIEAVRRLDNNDDVSEWMEQWHPNCDCKVVPVFKADDWPGRDAWKQAEKLWVDASREATALLESGEARSDNHNNEAINSLRRRIYRGDIDMRDLTP